MKNILLLIFALNLFAIITHAQILDTTKIPKIQIDKKGELSDFVKSAQAMLSEFDSTQVETGILYDRVIIPFCKIEDYSGDVNSKTLTKNVFKQLCFELEKASLKNRKLPNFDSLQYNNSDKGPVPIAMLNYNYNKLKDDAIETGLIENKKGKLMKTAKAKESPFNTKKIFAASTLLDHTFRGNSVTFHVSKELYFSNIKETPDKVQIDFDDGLGFRNINFNTDIQVSYKTKGSKKITVKTIDAENKVLTSTFLFTVNALSIPSYTTTHLVSDVAYGGVTASGDVYLFKSPVTSVIKNPIILIEGIDLDNSRFADFLYNTLNQNNLAECLLNNGYDIFMINFTDSRTIIQANGYFVVKAIQHINSIKTGKNGNVVIGASMGGLVGRYALRKMETNPEYGKHETKFFCSFDSPQKGANIPLGDQYWINFFASESSQAQTNINQLNMAAPQQMLVYHHLSFPNTNAYRALLNYNLSSLGYPQQCRNIAIANGSANGTGEPFSPGAQLLSYNFANFLILIRGNTWAVPDDLPFTQIVDCYISRPRQGLDPDQFGLVTFGTLPYDNAPGGYRDTNGEIARQNVDYGDITTTNPNHCFIPTISALDINTTDLFYNIQNDPDIMSKTPFDAIYYPVSSPSTNQVHVYISPEVVGWLSNELVPDNIILNGSTWNQGEVKAKNSITLDANFEVPLGNEFSAIMGTFTPCD